MATRFLFASELSFAVVTDERYHFDVADLDRVQRRLKQRHVQMSVLIFILFFVITDSYLRTGLL